MPFGVAWSTLPSPAFETRVPAAPLAQRAHWSPDDWFLNLMVELDGQPIGAQSIDAEGFAVHRTVHTGSWLGRRVPGAGFGKEMRGAVLAFAFDGLGARGRGDPRRSSTTRRRTAVSRALGYEPNGLGTTGARGRRRARPQTLPDDGRALAVACRAPPVDIEGLDALPRAVRDLTAAGLEPAAGAPAATARHRRR